MDNIKINYGKILEETLKNLEKEGVRPKLLMHACCAPCSSYVIEYLSGKFEMTILFYNPNISPESEYVMRSNELKRLISETGNTVTPIILPYDPENFRAISKGLENVAEGGERCFKCYRLRLEKAAEYAKNNGFDYFCTTLTISPHKNSAVLNQIGSEVSEKFGVPYLFSDFKKKNGYKRSCELSAIYGLYRQDYCGCAFSKAESIRRKNEKKTL